MAKEMLINVSEGEECRIALMENGRLEELYMERTSSTSHVGNIYKGRVTNVEASIQAAFVDFGLGRNGFLHISDLMPTYFGRKGEDIVETVGKKMARRDRPPIQRCLRRGDEIIVQIIKEGIGTKGPTLSSYLSIPGKYLVMMPGVGKMGVSQKIEDEVERRRLRQILDGLKPPKDVGFIIRTAGVGKSKLEIERDLKYLTRLWETLEKKRLAAKGPAELYAEGDLVTRTVRDFVSADVDRIVVDNADVADRVREVIKITTPRAKDRVELYDETVPLFHKYGIEREIEQMYSRHVPLPSGGSLVIDSTEAIVAIDVNSGKFREHNDAEMTAFKTDMEAADEIPRQLKLRDLGGVIICDFIDLRYERNRRELEKRLHDNFKNDRAKTKVLRMSQFGIIEMTRQRMRPSLKRSIYFDCPHCKGAGLVKTPESMSLDVMRRISIAINDLKVSRVELAVCPDVAFYLQNKKRLQIAELERQYDKRVLIRSEHGLGLDEMKLELFDSRDGLVMLPELDAALSQPPHKTQLNTRPHGRQQAPAAQGRGQGGGGGRFDNRRDQGRRSPQHAQQGRGGPPPARRDEDEARMDDRFELDEQEAEETPVEPDRGGGEDRPARDARQDRGGGDRPRQEQGGRQDRGGRGDRGDRDDRGNRDNRGNRGGRPQQAGAPGGNGPAREGRHPSDRAPQRGNERGGPPREDDREFNDAPLAPAGETQQRGPGEAGGPGGPEGEGGEGGARRRRRRRRGRRGRGRNRQQDGQPFPQQGEGQPADADRGPGEGEPQHAGERQGGYDDRGAEEDDEQGYRADEYDNGDVDRSEPLGDAPGEITDEDDEDREEASRPAARGRGGDEAVSYIVEEPVIEADGSGTIVSDGVEKTAYGAEPGAALEADAADDEAAEAQPEAPAAEAPEKGSRRRRGTRGGGRTAGGSRRSAAKAEQPAPAEPEATPAEAEPAEAKPRRRGTRGGRGRGRKAGATETAAGAAAEQSAAAAEPSPAPAPSTRRRAGAADKHLISDDPIIPEPVRRPRSSRDLDEIPDDLD